jgi:hypothetical protein
MESSNISSSLKESPFPTIELPAEETSKTRKKRKCLDIETKLAIIQMVAAGRPHTAIASEFGVSRTTISKLKKNASNIEALSEALPTSMQRKSLRLGNFYAMELALFQWYTEELQRGANVTGGMLKTQAMHLCKRLATKPFTASNGWLDGFRCRFKIGSRRPVTSVPPFGPEPDTGLGDGLDPLLGRGYTLEDVGDEDAGRGELEQSEEEEREGDGDGGEECGGDGCGDEGGVGDEGSGRDSKSCEWADAGAFSDGLP